MSYIDKTLVFENDKIYYTDEETTFEEGVLEFAQCMREEGINFPDPTFDIDGNPS